MDYNTQRPHLRLREYGRNVQNLINHLKTIEDKEERNKKATMLVELMKSINPDLNKDLTEYDQKIWDDLFIISNFELDVEGPFPKPDAAILEKKPQRLNYYSNEIKFRHYGRGVEMLINKVVEMEDEKEREGAVVTIGRLMKSFFQVWNKDNIEDEQVLKNIQQLSGGKLNIDIEKVKELGLFDSERKASYKNGGNRNKVRRSNNGQKKRNVGNKGRRRY